MRVAYAHHFGLLRAKKGPPKLFQKKTPYILNCSVPVVLSFWGGLQGRAPDTKQHRTKPSHNQTKPVIPVFQ